jgi:hypothetical protein
MRVADGKRIFLQPTSLQDEVPSVVVYGSSEEEYSNAIIHTMNHRQRRTVSSPPNTRSSQRRMVQVHMKYRTARDPTAEELLGQLSQDSGCAWLCQEVFKGKKPHLAWLPDDIAPLLSEIIQPALGTWRAKASCLASGAMRRAPDLKFCF